MPDFNIECEILDLLSKQDHKKRDDYVIVGLDEVGYGPLAGPVVAAAVYFPKLELNDKLLLEIKDSKKLSKKKRELLFDEIKKYAKYGIGYASVDEIDQFNILAATHKAMNRALVDLGLDISYVLVDGNKPPQLKYPIKSIVRGDNISISIAAASIIAKVTRDQVMVELHNNYPLYCWHKNKGYGTKDHINALNQYGITIHHRCSFEPVKSICK